MHRIGHTVQSEQPIILFFDGTRHGMGYFKQWKVCKDPVAMTKQFAVVSA